MQGTGHNQSSNVQSSVLGFLVTNTPTRSLGITEHSILNKWTHLNNFAEILLGRLLGEVLAAEECVDICVLTYSTSETVRENIRISGHVFWCRVMMMMMILTAGLSQNNLIKQILTFGCTTLNSQLLPCIKLCCNLVGWYLLCLLFHCREFLELSFSVLLLLNLVPYQLCSVSVLWDFVTS